jgi:hypothetical protein
VAPRPHHDVDIKSFGVCINGSVGAYWGVLGSGCVMFDSKGIGLTGSAGSDSGAIADRGSISGGPIFSTGTVQDQAGPFDTQTIGGGDGAYASSTYSTGKTLDGHNETTVSFNGGAGAGAQLSDGKSNTWVAYSSWPKFWHVGTRGALGELLDF